MEGMVVDVGFEDDLKDVKDTLGDHKKVLDDHTDKIQALEVDSGILKERWNNITIQLTRIENNALSTNTALLASNNSMLQTMNKLVDGNTAQSTNKTEVEKVKNNNTTQVILKVLGIAGAILAGFLMAKYGISVVL